MVIVELGPSKLLFQDVESRSRHVGPGVVEGVRQICRRSQCEIAGRLVVYVMNRIDTVVRVSDWPIVQIYLVIPRTKKFQ